MAHLKLASGERGSALDEALLRAEMLIRAEASAMVKVALKYII